MQLTHYTMSHMKFLHIGGSVLSFQIGIAFVQPALVTYHCPHTKLEHHCLSTQNLAQLILFFST